MDERAAFLFLRLLGEYWKGKGESASEAMGGKVKGRGWSGVCE